MRDTLAALVRNSISQIGSALASISAILFASIMLIELFGTESHVSSTSKSLEFMSGNTSCGEVSGPDLVTVVS